MEQKPETKNRPKNAMPCLSGMLCQGGAKDVPCEAPYYSPLRDYEQLDRVRVRRLASQFGHLEPEEWTLVNALQKKGLQADEDLAAEKARSKLKEVGRPICPRDLLEVMNKAVRERVRRYKDSGSVFQSSLVAAAILCREIVTAAVTPEETEDDREEA